MASILVTGSAGFIGSHFVETILNHDETLKLVSFDKLTYAGRLENLEPVLGNPRHKFVQGDIGDASLVEKIFQEHEIDAVIHFAAESHVDNSISGPETFIQTNIVGSFRLLEVCRKFWLDSRSQLKERFRHSRFLHVSTDEVYGSLGSQGYFTEDSKYAPNSPYSASKASSDMIARSYWKTYGLPVVISNCSNNYGPRQHSEKLIPTVIKKALAGDAIPIYGTGANVRDWIFVKDHCEALLRVFNQGSLGETYAIGGDCELDNLKLAHLLCQRLDEILPKPTGETYAQQIKFVEDRLGHDHRYAIDSKKIKHQLGFRPQTDLHEGLTETIKWYIDEFRKGEIISEKSFRVHS
ncbi:MAG: dTDP-glucose 4,6-dehydratase [Bdellovibrionota bacterium]